MGKLHDASLYILLAIVMLVAGCSGLTYKDLIPQQSAGPLRANPQFNGTVEIHSVLKPEWMSFSGDRDYSLPLKAYVDNTLLEKALKESVANSALFTRVEQKNADYVLDVWVDDEENYAPWSGMGEYGAGFFSIWRLTRVRDGKVLVCEFVDGHGLINTMVSAPRTHSLFAALQDLIQNGLRVLADTSQGHLAARPVAGIRPSMGSAAPEGLKIWEDNVQKNWSNLRKGLSINEVENIIGPVRESGALDRIYKKYKRENPADFTTTYYDKNTGAIITTYSAYKWEKSPKYKIHSYAYRDPYNGMEYHVTHLYVLIFNSSGLHEWKLW